MKRHKRIIKILNAVNYNESDSEGSNSHENGKDPFKDFDDNVSDPTYVPDENYPPASLTRESSGDQATCEYISCTSDVFAACSKCSSFLCWNHFDDIDSFNNCSYHNSNIQEPIDITLTELNKNDLFIDEALTNANDVDKALTGQQDRMSIHENFTNDCTTDIIMNTSSNVPVRTDNKQHQHCEYETCFEEVFSSCTQCQGFLCTTHFEKFIVDLSCSMHKPFSTEYCNDTDTVSNSLNRKKKNKKNIAKTNRNSGLKYVNAKKNIVEQRSIKKPCSDKTCRLKCTEKINDDERNLIFSAYWNLGDINRQRDFIKNHCEEVKPKYRYPCENCNPEKKTRAFNYAFYFEIDTKRVRVCKKFFKSTLDINDRVITTVRQKTDAEGFVAADRRGKHENRFKLTEETTDVHKFIDSIPRVESHYLRAQTTRQFIEGGRSLSQLYDDYKMTCKEKAKNCVSKTTFSRIFHNDFNISFFTPKKDRCEICVSYENSSEEEKAKLQASFNEHHKEKELSRAEKKRDKEKVNPLYVVACYDLQAVLPAPRGEVSVFYYISKLATYNLSVSELVTASTTCYVWHEGQGQRGVTEIGSCILKFLEKKSQQIDSDDFEVVFYSDNCCGQQKNKMMVALYIYAVNKFKIKSITHKFLIKGHTQYEGDSVHSTIEKEIKRALKCGPIYSPQEYITLIKTAKRNPPYYTVEELSFADFYDVKSLCDQIGNNFSKTTDNETIKITDIKVLNFRKDDPFAFYAKTSYENEEFKKLEVRKHGTRNKSFCMPENLNKAYTEKMKVNDKKKQEILKLINKRHVPNTYYDFYNAL